MQRLVMVLLEKCDKMHAGVLGRRKSQAYQVHLLQRKLGDGGNEIVPVADHRADLEELKVLQRRRQRAQKRNKRPAVDIAIANMQRSDLSLGCHESTRELLERRIRIRLEVRAGDGDGFKSWKSGDDYSDSLFVVDESDLLHQPKSALSVGSKC